MSIINYIEEHKGTSAIIGIIIVGGIIYVASTYKSTGSSGTGRSSNINATRSASNYNDAVTSLNLERSKNAITNNENILAYNASVNSTKANIIKENLQANAYTQNLIVKKAISEINANTQIINSKLSFASLEKSDNSMQKIVYLNAQKGIYQSFNESQAKIDQAYYNAQSQIGVANANAGAAERVSYNKYAYPAYEQMLEYIDR
ncbi:MAG TPA: hypothetical protein ENI61_04175 [Ignavibacteria bacterium]|nr:hypothetical protein [Ignavibacteria bacterium]